MNINPSSKLGAIQFASDEKVANRIENYRTLAGEELIDAVQEAGSEDAEVILESVIEYLGSPRRLRAHNFHDVLMRTRHNISPERYDLISKARIEGTWGAELALLTARERFTALHLKGVDKPANFFPPRLLMMRHSENGVSLNRDQLACAKSLEAAYERTKSLSMEQRRIPLEDLSSALEVIAEQLGTLTEWDLRPARVESLMKACAEFMSRRSDRNFDDQELFGHLSLPAIEMICESWSRLLDPFWEQAKQEVRDSFAYEDLPKGYIAIQAILQKLEGNALRADELFDMMSKVIDEAELMSRVHVPEIGCRATNKMRIQRQSR